MKKIKFLKAAVILFAVLAFSNCDEDGPIEFAVVDDFSTTVPVPGLEGKSAYTIQSETDISNLLDGAANFVNANIKTVSLALVDYSGSAISGTITVKVGGEQLFSKSVTLTGTATEISVPDNASDILNQINSGRVTLDISGTTAVPIEDNAFSIKVDVVVNAVVGS